MTYSPQLKDTDWLKLIFFKKINLYSVHKKLTRKGTHRLKVKRQKRDIP
jgi:hypothetical protein